MRAGIAAVEKVVKAVENNVVCLVVDYGVASSVARIHLQPCVWSQYRQLLYDFERMHIKAGATGLPTLGTSPKDVTQLDEEAVRYALPGEYTFRLVWGEGDCATAPHGGGWATTTLTMKTDDGGGLDGRK